PRRDRLDELLVGKVDVDALALHARVAVARLDRELRLQFLDREAAEARLPFRSSARLARRDRNTDVVGMRGQLEREVEGLPTRGVGADAAVDVTAAAGTEGLAILRAARPPGFEDLLGRAVVELADTDLVGGCQVDGALG